MDSNRTTLILNKIKNMEKTKLPSVTLLGIDCVDIDRLVQAAEICMKDFEFAEVKLLTSLPSQNPNIIKIEPVESIEEYSKFMIYKLDEYFTTSYVLVIQYDGFILNPSAWTNEFLNYDYIGAPWLVADWSVNDFGFPKNLLGKLIVGNGGFSLRSKKLTSLCAKLFRDGVFLNYHPEDVAICLHNRKLLEEKGIKFAPIEIAKKFSFEAENDECDVWDGQFGFHGLRWTDISKWLKDHPSYKIDNTLDKDKVNG